MIAQPIALVRLIDPLVGGSKIRRHVGAPDKHKSWSRE